MSTAGVDDAQRADLDARRAEIAAQYLKPRDVRPASSARGVHHVALICSDVERTVQFYDGVLGFPLIEMFENRDYRGSTHFFFDLGHGNTLAYFDLPGLGLGPYAEVLGGHHHLAISIDREHWQQIKDRFDADGIEYAHVDESSLYFLGPDGERLELISDPLLEMYGKPVG
ncbi:MAG: VOC family protein [Actinobacteria bacterium]|nr:VOC family protein [Actinomycetota bacterium]